MFRDVRADDTSGSANWQCHYFFQKDEDSDPHEVYNILEAKFRFEEGLIREHHDWCDFQRWASQSLGLAGFALGETEFLHRKVKESAAKKIGAFVAAHPEYAG